MWQNMIHAGSYPHEGHIKVFKKKGKGLINQSNTTSVEFLIYNTYKSNHLLHDIQNNNNM